MKNLFIILILLMVSCTTNKAKINNTTEQDKSFEILANAGSFGFRYKDGQTFRETDDAYKSLLKSKTPTDTFVKLFDTGNINGKLYALCALHKLDQKTFQSLSHKLQTKEKVNTQFGCMVGEESLEKIILEIENNNPRYQP